MFINARCEITGRPVGTNDKGDGRFPCPCSACTYDKQRTKEIFAKAIEQRNKIFRKFGGKPSPNPYRHYLNF